MLVCWGGVDHGWLAPGPMITRARRGRGRAAGRAAPPGLLRDPQVAACLAGRPAEGSRRAYSGAGVLVGPTAVDGIATPAERGHDMAQHVRDIMTDTPVSVETGALVTDVARLMRDEDIGIVLVTREEHLRGLVSDRDLVVRALAEGTDPQHMTVADLCSEELVTVTPDDDLDRAVELMREHSIRRLPVVEGDEPVGVISLGDLAIERDRKSALGDISSARPNT